MTFFTQRNNIKPMFRQVTPVVVLLCLFAADTLHSLNEKQSTGSYGILNNVFCPSSFKMFKTKSFFNPLLICFADLGLPICFDVFFMANCALILVSVFHCAVFAKFVKWFSFFATTADFGYDLLRHNLLLTRRLCLEPIAGTYQWSARFIITQTGRMSIKKGK